MFEKSVRKPNGRHGRIDVFVDAGSGLIAIAEAKNSGWDRMTERAVRINVSRQARQIWDYIESRLAEGNDVSPGVVFSRRPRMARRLALIEGLFAEHGISAVWQDESIAKRRARPGLKRGIQVAGPSRQTRLTPAAGIRMDIKGPIFPPARRGKGAWRIF